MYGFGGGASTAAPSLTHAMPWSSEGYQVDPNRARSDPQGAQGALTRAQWRLFEDRFLPLENEALATIGDATLPNTLADRAGAHVSQAFANTAGMTTRRLSRYGQSPDAEQHAVITRNRGLEQAVAHAGAENQTRTAVKDLQLALAGDALQIGQGISGQASQGLSSAAGMANAREEQGKAARSAQRQSNMAMLSSLAGAGLMAWMMP